MPQDNWRNPNEQLISRSRDTSTNFHQKLTEQLLNPENDIIYYSGAFLKLFRSTRYNYDDDINSTSKFAEKVKKRLNKKNI